MSRICQIPVEASAPSLVRSSGPVFDWGRGVDDLQEKSLEIPGFYRVGSEAGLRLSLDVFERPRVLWILAAAFRKGLTRDTVWDLGGIGEEDLACYLAAARVYKRGVLTKNVPASQGGLTANASNLGAYKIEIYERLEECFQTISEHDIIISDINLLANLPIRVRSQALAWEFSEPKKNIESLAHLTMMLRKHRDIAATSQFTVFIVGGGVAGDLVGLAAGLLGLQAHYIPTTLLSMADSSVGGKVGVNFDPWGKNQVGMFSNPKAVSICQHWLKTLPEDELKGGLVECLKHALLLGDMTLWHALEACSASGPSALSADVLAKVIQVKVSVVSRDPLEMGERAILNFGHTFGHVIETLALRANKRFLHGECVAVGMIHALRLSKKYFAMESDPFLKSLVNGGLVPDQSRLSDILGESSGIDKLRGEIAGLLLADKKLTSDHLVRLVLLKSPGQIARDENGSWTIPFTWDDAWHDIRETVQALLK